MAATLTAKLGLDASGFTATLTRVQKSLGKIGAIGVPAVAAGFAAAGAAAGAMAVGIKKAIDIGGALSELSARTGVAAGDLRVLQMAFDRTGVGAEKVGPAINKMQKAIVEAGQGSKTAQDALGNLGLSVSQLSAMSPDQQFAAISKAIGGLSDPAKQATAAMQIFGKSGGEMLALFQDSGALGDAARAIGSQAALLTKNANMFDRASDILNTVGSKLEGFFVGVADKVVPALMPLLEKIDGLDFAAIGQGIGDAISFGLSALTGGDFGSIVWAQLKVAALNFTNLVYRGLQGSLAFLSQYFSGYLPTVLGAALKDLFGGVTGFLSGALNGNAFGQLGDIIANSFVYATLRWQVALFDTIKAAMGLYSQLFSMASGIGTKNLSGALSKLISFFASDLGQAIQNPMAYISGKLSSSFAKVAVTTAQEYQTAWDASTGNIIEKAYAGVSGAAEAARQNVATSSGALASTLSGASNQASFTGTLEAVASEGSKLASAFSEASKNAGDIVDVSGASSELDALITKVNTRAEATAAQTRAQFTGTKTAIPDMADTTETTGKVNQGVIAQSLQAVGGGGLFSRFSDASNPAQAQLRESQKQTGLLQKIAEKLAPTQQPLMAY